MTQTMHPPTQDGSANTSGITRATAETRFGAMGTEVHILVVGAPNGGSPEEILARSVERVGDLESRWTRFGPSEISTLNESRDCPSIVSPETFELIEKSVLAWRRTAGRFDPTVLDAMIRNGYDRSFELLRPPAAGAAGNEGHAEGPEYTKPVQPTPGCGSILLDAQARLVLLPAGVGIDPGGIGKGLAADIVTREALAAGAAGALVNVGGDLRVVGTPPVADTWSIELEDPVDTDKQIGTIAIANGAVTSTSNQRRRWEHDGHRRHHLIDPRTGRPTANDVAGVTAVAAEAWWAEAATKSLFVGSGDPLDAVPGTSAIVVYANGRRSMTPDLEHILR